MSRALAALSCSLIAAVSGCAMCASPYDYTYSAFGGRVQREDMCYGRVGSILGPAGGMTVVPYEEPVPTEAVPVEAEDAPLNGPPVPPNVPSAPPVVDPEDGGSLEEVMHFPLQ